jgi:hypothetical protein
MQVADLARRNVYRWVLVGLSLRSRVFKGGANGSDGFAVAGV